MSYNSSEMCYFILVKGSDLIHLISYIALALAYWQNLWFIVVPGVQWFITALRTGLSLGGLLMNI